MTRLLQSIESPYVGVSDPSLLYCWRDMFVRHPEAPVVVINRDYKDVMDSWFLATAGRPDLQTQGVEKVLNGMAFELDALKASGRRHMAVPFEELSQDGVCRDIWEYCVPHATFDLRRCAALQAMKVEAIFDQQGMIKRYRESAGKA
jgi:hypothetical protein